MSKRQEITVMNFQVVAAGKTRLDLQEFCGEIEQAIRRVISEKAPDPKAVFRFNQGYITGIVNRRIWRILKSNPLIGGAEILP